MSSKRYCTTVWDPVRKKVCHFEVRKGEYTSETDAEEQLKAWREEQKSKFKLEKAQLIIEEATEAPTEEVLKYEHPDLRLDHRTGCVIGFCASSRSGKTYLMKYLYDKYFKDEDYITTMFACNRNAPIYDDMDKNIVQMTTFNQTMPKLAYKINKATKNKYKFLFMNDDQVDSSTKHSQTLKKMMVSYRNSKISTMITFQFASLLTKTARGNIHYMFLGRMSTEEGIEDIIRRFLNSYLGGRSVPMCEKIKRYREVTSNYGWFLVDNINDRIAMVRI